MFTKYFQGLEMGVKLNQDTWITLTIKPQDGRILRALAINWPKNEIHS